MKKDIMKKLKILALVGVGVFVLTGALVIWAGVSLFNSLENNFDSYKASAEQAATQAKAEIAGVDFNKALLDESWSAKILRLQSEGCWNEISQTVSPENILTKPLAPQWAKIKDSCWKETPAS